MMICVLVLAGLGMSASVANAGFATAYGKPTGCSLSSIYPTPDGGYITGGFVGNPGNNDFWVMKLDPTRGIEWQNRYGGPEDDHLSLVRPMPDGGYVAIGITRSFGAGGEDAWILKLDNAGGIQWQNTYGGPRHDGFTDFQPTSDGGYLVTGFIAIDQDDCDAWVVKLDSMGQIQWQKAYGSRGFGHFEGFRGVQPTSDGDYLVVGDAYNLVGEGWHNGGGPYGDDGWLVKLDSSGQIQWQNAYDGSETERFYDIRILSDGGYILTGSTRPDGGRADGWIVRLDSSGQIQWQNAYGGSGTDSFHRVLPTPDGGYLAAGTLQSSSTGRGFDQWLVKLDSMGQIQWQKGYGSSEVFDSLASFVRLPDGYIAAGLSNNLSSKQRGLILKFDDDGDVLDGCLEQPVSAPLRTTTATMRTSSIPLSDGTANASVQATQVTPVVDLVEQIEYLCGAPVPSPVPTDPIPDPPPTPEPDPTEPPEPSAVPEPATAVLVGLGLLGLIGMASRRKRQ
jgi:hypothetical protein